MKKVAVVILNWNGVHLLRHYLPTVCQYTSSDLADIYVADNGSTDNSLDVLKKEFPDIHVIAMPDNTGFASGYNIALDSIQHPYIVLLNSDVAVTPNWLEPLVGYADENPDVAASQPKILSDRNRRFFEHAGACGGYIDKYGFPFCRGRLFDHVEEDKGQYDTVTDIFWATGACLFIRNADFKKAGGLDPLFFAHMEEIDLCWRLRQFDRRIVCIPQSAVYHQGGATLDMDNPRKTYLNFRNNILMLYKNLPAKDRQKTLFIRMLMDGIAALGFMAKGKVGNVRAVWRAHRDARSMIRENYRNAYSKGGRQKLLGIFPYSEKSIVSEYYLKGKKRFSDLSL